MSYTDLGYPAIDGKEHLRLHLLTKATEDWKVKEIVTYPKALTEHLNPPVIQIDFMNEEEPESQGSGSKTYFHTCLFRIWYFSDVFSVKSRFEDVILRLSQIRKYLLENSSPDSYGELLYSTDGSRVRGFNITVGAIDTGLELYTGGYIDVYLWNTISYS